MTTHEIIDNLARKITNGGTSGLRENAISLLELILKDEGTNFKFNWHPLGFIHLKLKEYDDGTAVRLHIWSDKERRRDPSGLMIHKHNFHIKSYVLTGKIKNVVYEKIETNTSKILKKYVVKYEGIKSKLESSGELISLTKTICEEIEKGQIYHVPISFFHESIVQSDSLTCTIAVTYTPITTLPMVAGNGENSYAYKRESCRFSIVKDALGRIIYSLKEQQ